MAGNKTSKKKTSKAKSKKVVKNSTNSRVKKARGTVKAKAKKRETKSMSTQADPQPDKPLFTEEDFKPKKRTRDAEGKLHSEGDEPALVMNWQSRWYKHGQLHRDGDKPAIDSRDRKEYFRDGRRHRDGGPCVIHEYGAKDWWLHGVRVPQWLAEQPAAEIDPKRFYSDDAILKNVELRQVFIRKVGLDRIFTVLKATVLDKKTIKIDGVDHPYEVLHVDLGEAVGNWPVLKMLNPSTGGTHVEFVGKDVTTVDGALEFRNGTKDRPTFLS